VKAIMSKENTKPTLSDYGLLTPQQCADMLTITVRSFWTYVLTKEIPRECIVRFGMTVLVDKDCLIKAGKHNALKYFKEKDAQKNKKVEDGRGAERK